MFGVSCSHIVDKFCLLTILFLFSSLNDRIVSTLCLLGVESMEDLSYFYNNEDLMKQMKDKLKALDFAKFKDAKNKVCV